MENRFRDRAEAGRALAQSLTQYANNPDVLVLSLPRGGVPVAYTLAQELRATLDIFDVRTLSVPDHPEMTMGAIGSGGVVVINQEVVQSQGIPEWAVLDAAARKRKELNRQEMVYRGRRPLPKIQGRTIIFVDDGESSDSTLQAAIAALKSLEPTVVILAVPSALPTVCDDFRDVIGRSADVSAKELYDVGLRYEDFTWVVGLLAQYGDRPGTLEDTAPPSLLDQSGQPGSAAAHDGRENKAGANPPSAKGASQLSGTYPRFDPSGALPGSREQRVRTFFRKYHKYFTRVEVLIFGAWGIGLLVMLWLLFFPR